MYLVGDQEYYYRASVWHMVLLCSYVSQMEAMELCFVDHFVFQWHIATYSVAELLYSVGVLVHWIG